jgi:hypothetical protein
MQASDTRFMGKAFQGLSGIVLVTSSSLRFPGAAVRTFAVEGRAFGPKPNQIQSPDGKRRSL